mmetsp:Transcript_33241/g.54307  ORF Transcript_33241/g.54307 Transcript_33241/m.54307 type:complete len:256 (+) Transcript_33241:307-1074(+)
MADNTKNGRSSAEVSCLVAYQCINARGAIAHGKNIQLKFSSEQAIEKVKQGLGAKEVLGGFGGAKELSSAEEIKEEIMKRGPVVSTSFEPNEAFLDQNSSLRQQMDFLIVGWTQEPAGEVWIVAPLAASNFLLPNVHVSFGQFGIDDCCVAPIDSLENLPWESGPYLDINMTGVDVGWRTGWEALTHNVTKISDIEPLLKEIGTVRISSPRNGVPPQDHLVCIRDINKKAHSRRGILRSVEWIKNQWKITVSFSS